MKITMYELLGMIKDGKAPKKIKYDDMIWVYNGRFYNGETTILLLEEYCNLAISLNDEVEILEEEKKKPEKLEPLQKDYMTLDDIKFTFSNSEMILVDKINEIIDYLKKEMNKICYL